MADIIIYNNILLLEQTVLPVIIIKNQVIKTISEMNYAIIM